MHAISLRAAVSWLLLLSLLATLPLAGCAKSDSEGTVPTLVPLTLQAQKITSLWGTPVPEGQIQQEPALVGEGSAAVQGESFFQQLPAAGGIPPYTWSLVSGNLPAGLTLDANGTISGTPTTEGGFTFSVAVSDSEGASDSVQHSITVVPPGGTGGTYYSFVFTCPMYQTHAGEYWADLDPGKYFAAVPYVQGGARPWTFTITGLPDGLNYDPATGLVQGPLSGLTQERIIIKSCLKDAGANDATGYPSSEFHLKAITVPVTPGGGGSGMGGTLSISADRGDIYVSGYGYAGRGSATISLAAGTYTVTVYRSGTSQVCYQTTTTVYKGQTSLVKTSGKCG